MKSAIYTLAVIAAALTSTKAFAADHCEKYQQLPKRIEAIATVAAQLKYSMNDICNLERIADIYVTDKSQYDENGDVVELDWVTLHYNEYSCQYFIRKDNRQMFAKNCYNTF